MTDNENKSDQAPFLLARDCRRQPIDFARRFGDTVKASVAILFWSLVALASLAIAFVIIRALFAVVQLAWKALGF